MRKKQRQENLGINQDDISRENMGGPGRKSGKNVMPNTVSRLLSRSDIQGLIDDFIQDKMIDAESLVLVYEDKDGVHMRTAGVNSTLEAMGLLDVANHIMISLGSIDE